MEIFQHDLQVTRQERAAAKDQSPKVLWFTGLSGAGKTTLANALDQYLTGLGKHVYVLDGDNVRYGLSSDLSFSVNDRTENIRRVSEVAKLMYEAGLIVIVAFISPLNQDRQHARQLIGDDFVEVFIDTPLEVAEGRDCKGLYKKARAGELKEFTGISSPYEVPTSPELHLRMDQLSISEAVKIMSGFLLSNDG